MIHQVPPGGLDHMTEIDATGGQQLQLINWNGSRPIKSSADWVILHLHTHQLQMNEI